MFAAISCSHFKHCQPFGQSFYFKGDGETEVGDGETELVRVSLRARRETKMTEKKMVIPQTSLPNKLKKPSSSLFQFLSFSLQLVSN